MNNEEYYFKEIYSIKFLDKNGNVMGEFKPVKSMSEKDYPSCEKICSPLDKIKTAPPLMHIEFPKRKYKK